MSEFQRSLAKCTPLDSAVLSCSIDYALKRQSAALYVAAGGREGAELCTVSGCPNVRLSLGFCNAHYLRAKAGRDMLAPLQHRSRKLSCQECSAPVDGKGGWGLCKPHYRKKRRDIIKRECVKFLGGACSECGGVFPLAVYDFHHVDPASKDGDPSTLFDNASLAVVADEVVKCELLCANCHRIKHNE
jgi:5-methylcytosine-specific restriction endonuclease McrA